jgi:hypothetical protein
MSSLKKYDVQIPPRVIDKLKRISNLSGKRRWEYAGRIVVKDKFKFEDPIFVTSKNRSQVKYNTVTKLWPSPICFHTHPCKSHSSGVFCTLPSKHDFEVFIYNFPLIQSNIICDGHGYYVINVLASAEGGYCASPRAVELVMKKFRTREDLQAMLSPHEGLEYFESQLDTWKEIIDDLNTQLTRIFGISIRYYAYEEDEPPVITLLDV